MTHSAGKLRIGCLSFPDGAVPSSVYAKRASAWVTEQSPDLVITSELPFGEWLATSERFDDDAADRSRTLHCAGQSWLASLPVPLIATSRAVAGVHRLRNEASLIVDGRAERSHDKQFLPKGDGWHETSWFEPGAAMPRLFETNGIRIGILLCTEAMFSEQARRLGLHGVELIAVPRATGPSEIWPRALAMAAISAGSFVISVNRDGGPFAGSAIGFAPDGEPLRRIDGLPEFPLFEIELQAAVDAKADYPCEVFSRVAAAAARVTEAAA